MSIESVMPSNHLFLCCPLFILPSIFPSIRVDLEGGFHKYITCFFSPSPSLFSGLFRKLFWTFSDCLLPCQVMNGNYWCVSSFSQQYFNKRKTYFAHDALQQCTVGDIVLLKALPVPRTKHVKHELAEIVFKVGQVVDPVTGKRCAGTTYLESPVDLETTPLAKNLEELNLSTTQWRRIGKQSQKGISKFTLWKSFSQFPHKPSSFSSGIYEITKNKWSKVFFIIFHKGLWLCFRFPSWWTYFSVTQSMPSNPLHCFVSSLF